MSEFMIQAVIRVVVTGFLILVVGLCLSQIYRIWFDKTIILNPFSYLKANDNSTTSGLYFTTLVSQDLLDIRNLYARPRGSAAKPAQPAGKPAQGSETVVLYTAKALSLAFSTLPGDELPGSDLDRQRPIAHRHLLGDRIGSICADLGIDIDVLQCRQRLALERHVEHALTRSRYAGIDLGQQ